MKEIRVTIPLDPYSFQTLLRFSQSIVRDFRVFHRLMVIDKMFTCNKKGAKIIRACIIAVSRKFSTVQFRLSWEKFFLEIPVTKIYSSVAA